MKKPLLSIIIPIYNVEKYLVECLQSVYDVKSSLLEVILINDGSTDNSLQISEVYSEKNLSNTKLITRINGGLSAARNTGLEHATGEWVMFLDSDDFIDPVSFQEVIKQIKKTKADAIAFSGFRFIQKTGKTLPLHIKENPFIDKGPIDSKTYLSKILEIGMTNIVTVWDKVYRRSALEKFNLQFIEGLIHEDVLFTFEFLLNSISIEYINIAVIYYRQREGSIMSTKHSNKSESKLKILHDLLILFDDKKTNNVYLNGYLVFLAKNIVNDRQCIPQDLIKKIKNRKLKINKIIILSYVNIKNSFLKYNYCDEKF